MSDFSYSLHGQSRAYRWNKRKFAHTFFMPILHQHLSTRSQMSRSEYKNKKRMNKQEEFDFFAVVTDPISGKVRLCSPQEWSRTTSEERNLKTICVIEGCLDDINKILQQQPPELCRKNVWETISILEHMCPDHVEFIQKRYKEIIRNNNIDFFRVIRQNPKKEESDC